MDQLDSDNQAGRDSGALPYDWGNRFLIMGSKRHRILHISNDKLQSGLDSSVTRKDDHNKRRSQHPSKKDQN